MDETTQQVMTKEPKYAMMREQLTKCAVIGVVISVGVLGYWLELEPL